MVHGRGTTTLANCRCFSHRVRSPLHLQVAMHINIQHCNTCVTSGKKRKKSCSSSRVHLSKKRKHRSKGSVAPHRVQARIVRVGHDTRKRVLMKNIPFSVFVSSGARVALPSTAGTRQQQRKATRGNLSAKIVASTVLKKAGRGSKANHGPPPLLSEGHPALSSSGSRRRMSLVTIAYAVVPCFI